MQKIIKDAIKKNKVLVYYQPIYGDKQNIIKSEALMRINYNGSILLPQDFLQEAKNLGLYPELERIVLIKVFEHLRAFREMIVSVNVAAEDISNPETLSLLEEKLLDESVAKRVIFEITEDLSALANKQEIITFTEKAKQAGAMIAIDDFGIGFSNYTQLIHIDPDFIKIDGSIIQEIDKNQKAEKIIKSIVSLARELNIKTIAEYVTSHKIYRKCISSGVDEFQGFLFGKPRKNVTLL